MTDSCSQGVTYCPGFLQIDIDKVGISWVCLNTWANFDLYIPSLSRGRRQWHPTPVLLPGESHGWRSLVGCSPWGREELNTTEQLHFHFSLSCIGEGNGNLLQCSCLEYPRDRGAWWAAVYGSHRVRHNWSDLVAANINKYINDKMGDRWNKNGQMSIIIETV